MLHHSIPLHTNHTNQQKDLQIGNSSRLELVAFREAKNRYRDEQLVQKDNQEFHIHGEWFTSQAKLTILKN